MRLAVQEDMLPGASLEERFQFAEKAGIEGVEVWSAGLAERMDKLRGLTRLMGIRACVVACSFRASLLSPEEDERRWATAELRRLLTLSARLGALGVVYTPAWGAPRIDVVEDQTLLRGRHLDELAHRLSDVARQAEMEGVRLLLEPVDRFESYLLVRLADTARLCQKLGGDGIGLVANLYHMRVEGEKVSEGATAAGQFLRYARVADTGRRLPGMGQADLRGELAALKAAGYDGYVGLDCVVPGQNASFRDLFARGLPAAVEKMKAWL